MTEEQAIERAKHEAEEHGKEFDPNSVTGPVTYYQIKTYLTSREVHLF